MSHARSWAWIGAGTAMSALVAFVGCGDDASGSGAADAQGGASVTGTTAAISPTSSPGATSGGDGGAGTTGPVTAGVTQGPGPVAVSSAASTGGGGAPGCEAPAGSLYAQTAVDYATFQQVNLCEYQGQVLLLVDIAAL